MKETPTTAHVQVTFHGEKIADTNRAILLTEDGHPDRFYIPREDVRMQVLERTKTTTECPFKGVAHYYSLHMGDQTAQDAVWTYEDPYEEHQDLKDRLAFYTEKFEDLNVKSS